MMPRGWELLLKGTLEHAGVGALPVAERERIARTLAARLRQFGVRPELHNWGGVLCGRPSHDGCCEFIGGRRLQRFADDFEGVRRLVELCCLYTGANAVEGFRSELRAVGFFGPNEEATKTFQGLCAAWAGLEADFGSNRLKGSIVKASYEAWLAFRDKWQSGDADTTALGAMVAEVNMARSNLGKPRTDIRAPEVTQTTTALKVADGAQSAGRIAKEIATEITRDAAAAGASAWKAVPLSAKIGAAAVAVLSVALAVFGVTR